MLKSLTRILLVIMLTAVLAACNTPADSTTDTTDTTSTTIEDKGELTIAKATWDTGWFQAAVFETMLEELGYEVEDLGTLDNAAFYTSAALGDVDMWFNGWFPLHDPFLEGDQVAGRVQPVGFQVEAGALQGYLVDKATADELGITSLMDFTDPEIAAAFDSDGDGKADLIGCDAGWGCETVIENTLDELELRDSITHQQGTYSALMADTIGRYSRGESILFYTWTPNWTVSQLKLGEDVVWIEAPIESVGPVDGIPGCVVDPCAMGFDPADIRAVANTELLENNPDIATLLELVEIPLNDIAEQNQLMVDGEDSDEDIARHAAEWIAENREQVDAWLEAARAAG